MAEKTRTFQEIAHEDYPAEHVWFDEKELVIHDKDPGAINKYIDDHPGKTFFLVHIAPFDSFMEMEKIADRDYPNEHVFFKYPADVVLHGSDSNKLLAGFLEDQKNHSIRLVHFAPKTDRERRASGLHPVIRART